MKHWCCLIPWQKALSGNNVFLSALPCLTSDRKTAGHNYPVCSQADGFYYLNLFGRERELGGASLYHFLVMLCSSALMSLSVICCRFVLFTLLNEGKHAFPRVREATLWCKSWNLSKLLDLAAMEDRRLGWGIKSSVLQKLTGCFAVPEAPMGSNCGKSGPALIQVLFHFTTVFRSCTERALYILCVITLLLKWLKCYIHWTISSFLHTSWGSQ